MPFLAVLFNRIMLCLSAAKDMLKFSLLKYCLRNVPMRLFEFASFSCVKFGSNLTYRYLRLMPRYDLQAQMVHRGLRRAQLFHSSLHS